VASVGRLDDVPIKKDNPPAPDWVTEGVVVEHDTLGRGVVRRVGLYKRFHTTWIEFDSVGVKALMPMYATAHMRPVGVR
jgi:hypothetical protein